MAGGAPARHSVPARGRDEEGRIFPRTRGGRSHVGSSSRAPVPDEDDDEEAEAKAEASEEETGDGSSSGSDDDADDAPGPSSRKRTRTDCRPLECATQMRIFVTFSSLYFSFCW